MKACCRHGTSYEGFPPRLDFFLTCPGGGFRQEKDEEVVLRLHHQLDDHTAHRHYLLRVHNDHVGHLWKEEEEIFWRNLQLWFWPWEDSPHWTQVVHITRTKLNSHCFSDKPTEDIEDSNEHVMSRKPRFLVYWMTTTSLSTLTSYTTTLTVASLTCTPSAFELSLCGWPRDRTSICFGSLDSSHKAKFCLDKVFVATSQNYCRV